MAKLSSDSLGDPGSDAIISEAQDMDQLFRSKESEGVKSSNSLKTVKSPLPSSKQQDSKTLDQSGSSPSPRVLEGGNMENSSSDTSGGPKSDAIVLEARDMDRPFLSKEGEGLNGPKCIISKVFRQTTTSLSVDEGPPPDGGLQAWTTCFMVYLIIFNTWGYMNTFGAFQTYYLETLHHPPSDVSWVGSMQIFLVFFAGSFSGRAMDYGLFKPTLFIGSILQLIGVFMTSLSTRYWQFFLAQGICTGLGSGLVFCPALSLLSTYFSKKRSLAIGIAGSGSATGGLVFPSIVRQLLPKIGLPWTVRVMGFVMLAVTAVTITFTKTRLPPRPSGTLFELEAFKELPYALFAIGMFLNFLGIYFAFYFIGSFGRNILGLSESESVNNLLILNGMGLVGRLIPNHLADRYFGPLNCLIPFVFVSGVLLYSWAVIDSKGGLTAFAVAYGFFGGGIQSLFPATLSSLTTDVKTTGARMGMVFSVVSFACLTGPPVAGALIQRRGGGYLHAQMFAGTMLMAGCATLVASRIAAKGWRKARV